MEALQIGEIGLESAWQEALRKRGLDFESLTHRWEEILSAYGGKWRSSRGHWALRIEMGFPGQERVEFIFDPQFLWGTFLWHPSGGEFFQGFHPKIELPPLPESLREDLESRFLSRSGDLLDLLPEGDPSHRYFWESFSRVGAFQPELDSPISHFPESPLLPILEAFLQSLQDTLREDPHGQTLWSWERNPLPHTREGVQWDLQMTFREIPLLLFREGPGRYRVPFYGVRCFFLYLR